jgi:hypothetical protein
METGSQWEGSFGCLFINGWLQIYVVYFTKLPVGRVYLIEKWDDRWIWKKTFLA